MSRLPRVTGRQMLRALRRTGFVVVRVAGSHHFLSHPEDPTRWATVPVHAGEILPRKVVQAILKSTRLSAEDLKELL